MAYVAPVVQVSGDIITAAIWNQNVVNNMIAVKAIADGATTAAAAAVQPTRTVTGDSGVGGGGDLSTNRTLNWSNRSSDKNLILNGDFGVAQLGTSFSATGYELDQWYLTLGSGATATASQQAFTIGQPLGSGNGEPRYFMQLAVAVAGSGATTINQPIESVRVAAAQKVTLGFWCNCNTGSATVNVWIRQNFGTGGSPSSSVDSSTTAFTFTGSWAYQTMTVTLADIVGKTLGSSGDDRLEVWFSFPTANGNVTYRMADVQLELGGTGTPFARRTFHRELELCKRYLQVYGGTAAADQAAAGFTYATTNGIYNLPLPVEMRVIPSLSLSAASDWSVYSATGSGIACTAITLTGGQTSKKTASLAVTTASGLTAGAGSCMMAANTNARLKLDARY